MSTDGTNSNGLDGTDETPFTDDFIADDDRANDLVTNDAVAGETVLPGDGDGNDGPTGGSPRELQPDYGPEAPGVENVTLGDDDDENPEDLDGPVRTSGES